jgi:hypothetical protein
VPVQLIKAWSINPNVRNAYITMLDMGGWFIYENHAFLKTKGWTVVGTSDGLTAAFDGPADRLASKANCQVIAAIVGAPQSWSLLENTDGVQLLITYQGSSSDRIRISYSPGGLFVVNSPATHQPTATDEMVVSTGNTVVDPTVGLDRVMTIWASNDSKHWMVALYRNGTTITNIGVERVTDITGATGVFAVPYVGYRWNNYTMASSAATTILGGPMHNPTPVAFGAATFFGCGARVFTGAAFRTTRISAGNIFLSATPDGFNRSFGAFFNDSPALQGGLEHALVTPFWNGESVVNLEGFVAAPIDFYYSYTSSLTASPAFGTFYPGWEPGDTPGVTSPRTNWLIAFGPAMVRPWRDAAPTLEII